MSETPIFCPICGKPLNESGFCEDPECPQNTKPERDLDQQVMNDLIYSNLL